MIRVRGKGTYKVLSMRFTFNHWKYFRLSSLIIIGRMTLHLINVIYITFIVFLDITSTFVLKVHFVIISVCAF